MKNPISKLQLASQSLNCYINIVSQALVTKLVYKISKGMKEFIAAKLFSILIERNCLLLV